MKWPTSRGAEQGLKPACGGWLLDLTPQDTTGPGSLPARSPSPPAFPHTAPVVSGCWNKRYQLGSIYKLSKSCLSKLFLSSAQVVSPPPPFPCTLLCEGWALAGTHWLFPWHRLTAIIFHVLACPSGTWGWWEGLSCSLLPSPKHLSLWILVGSSGPLASVLLVEKTWGEFSVLEMVSNLASVLQNNLVNGHHGGMEVPGCQPQILPPSQASPWSLLNSGTCCRSCCSQLSPQNSK